MTIDRLRDQLRRSAAALHETSDEPEHRYNAFDACTHWRCTEAREALDETAEHDCLGVTIQPGELVWVIYGQGEQDTGRFVGLDEQGRVGIVPDGKQETEWFPMPHTHRVVPIREEQ